MKNVDTGFLGLSEERKPFHPACWEMHHKKEKRRNMLLVLFAVLAIGTPIVYAIIRYVLL